jgi:hypothetical protein
VRTNCKSYVVFLEYAKGSYIIVIKVEEFNHPNNMLVASVLGGLQDYGPIHLAYNPSFSVCFSVGTVFFSHNKLANSVFQPIISTAERGL